MKNLFTALLVFFTNIIALVVMFVFATSINPLLLIISFFSSPFVCALIYWKVFKLSAKHVLIGFIMYILVAVYLLYRIIPGTYGSDGPIPAGTVVDF